MATSFVSACVWESPESEHTNDNATLCESRTRAEARDYMQDCSLAPRFFP
jgi:hypothetical protein